MKSCNIYWFWSGMSGHVLILQNNKVPISLGSVELFCVLFACRYTSIEVTMSSCCFSWLDLACPKFSETINCQYLWKELSGFWDFLCVVICIFVICSISWHYKTCELSSWFLKLQKISIEATENIMLFCVMIPKYFWPISLQIFSFELCDLLILILGVYCCIVYTCLIWYNITNTEWKDLRTSVVL